MPPGSAPQKRALERLLPLLQPGKSARLAMLPEGKDPDDLLQKEGGDGLLKVISTASSLIDSLWTSFAAEHDLRQPEQRAEFWQAVRGQVRQIGHNQVRTAFADEIEARIAALNGNATHALAHARSAQGPALRSAFKISTFSQFFFTDSIMPELKEIPDNRRQSVHSEDISSVVVHISLFPFGFRRPHALLVVLTIASECE